MTSPHAPTSDPTVDAPVARLLRTAHQVRDAARWLARASSAQKDDALQRMADALRDHAPAILEANEADLARGRDAGAEAASLDRLRLDRGRIEAMAAALEEIVALPDPVGRMEQTIIRPNGLEVGRKRIPLGVIGIIYEARPNVTSDAAGLCLKSGNGVLLKGGSDAIDSNRAVYRALREGLGASALDARAHAAIGFVDTTDRDVVRRMLELDEYLDVLIPRGGKGLIRFVHEHARVPVIKHDEGVCHVVVDGTARPERVDAIVLNAKTQRPTVCNAMETLLLLDSAVDPHLDRVLGALVEAGVHLHLDPRSAERAKALDLPQTAWEPADDDAYAREFLGLELAVRVVEDLEAAVDHITRFGSRHTEALLTEDYSLSRAFVDAVDSACVVINASTRFADGGELGLGAEIGISTTRLHAYGPMGLEELTTTKFVVFGDGQVRT